MSDRISLGPSLSSQIAANERNVTRYRKTQARVMEWNWRAFLTQDEAAAIAQADAAKAEWQRLNAARAGITNRAIQRAKAAAANMKDEP